MVYWHRLVHFFTGHPLSDSEDIGLLMYCRPCRRIWTLADWRM